MEKQPRIKCSSYQILVHIFGATDSPCCTSFALKQAVLDQRDKFPAKFIAALLRDFYMDDWLTSVFHEIDGKLISAVDTIMANRAFNLTKYNTKRIRSSSK